MSTMRTYLDHNATAPHRPEVRSAMIAALDCAGNPSSIHAEGRRARAIVEDAREEVAALAGARPVDVIFTSGATEASNAVLRGTWHRLVVTRLEHPSVLAPALACTAERVEVAVDASGVADAGRFAEALAAGAGPNSGTLVILQAANNEIGTLQPVAEVAATAKAHGAKLLSDAVQAAGRLPLDFAAGGVDYMTLSAHKLGGPKGVGALIAREGAPLASLHVGGGQERRRRGGTENVVGIAGFGAAATAARRDLADMARIARLRDRLEREALAMSPDAVIIGRDGPRLANTTCLAWPGASAETLVIKLDLAGIAVSAGAACSSGKVGASEVLAAIGLAPDLARSAIRVSLGWSTTERDVDAFLQAWRTIAGRTTARPHERAVA
jgi:cysteine desulfurase